jgi:surface protein
MKYMFSGCWLLTSLDLSSFNTSKVTDMRWMFYGSNNLRTIYVGNGWSTAAVTSSNYMFNGCTSLVGGQGTTYDSSHTDKAYARIDGGPSNPGYFTEFKEAYACYTPSNTTLTFYYDNQRSSRTGTTYDLNTGSNDPGWYTDGTYSNVTKVVFNSSFASARPTTTYYWFGDMSKLQSITGTQYFNTSQVTNMCLMFAGAGAMMPNLDANFLNTSNVKTMESMFANSEFTSIIVSDWNTSEVTNMLEMFAFCYNLTSLDLSNFNTSKVTTMEGMFNEDYILVSLDLSNWNTSNVTNMNNMFHECNALTSVDLSSFNTAKVTTMYSMFDYCTSLTSLDLSSFNTSKVTDMRWMFSSCSELTTIYAGNGWSTAATTDSNSDGMFRECTKIRGGQGTTYNASHTNRLYARIDGGPSNPGYFTDKNAGLRGDVNGDGSVNIDDVTALIDYLLGSNSSINVANADADQSGGVSIDDVTALIDYLLTGRWS